MLASVPRPDAAPSILLVPIGPVCQGLGAIRTRLEETFRCAVGVDAGWNPSPSGSASAPASLMDASKLLVELLERYPRHEGKLVGVTGFDLKAPGRPWLFGQAQLQGSAAVISAHRLCETFYGRAPDPGRECRRLFIELCHELGHAFGLLHCDAAQCLMRWSGTVEEIEEKGELLCARCAEQLRALREEAAASIPAGRWGAA